MPRDDDTHPGGGTPPPASVASSPTLPMLEPLRAPDDRYEVTRELARGGIGRVLEARDRRLDRTVAVKELLSHDRETEARFARESQLTGQLEHPSIVPVHDAGHWSNGKPYYVMKRVTGRSLLDCIRETRTPAERMALLPKVIAVAEAIAYAHSQRVIHRDIKPANVLIGQYGETVVIDWGLAKRLGEPDEPASTTPRRPSSSDQTSAGTVLGTPAYMAPEQARGSSVDERADVYALGALLYHVLGGEPPGVTQGEKPPSADASAPTEQPSLAPAPPTIPDKPPAITVRPLAERAPELPPDLLLIVEKAMSPLPSGRYANARELAADLERFQTGQLVSARRYSLSALTARWLKRHRGIVGLAAAALLAAAATAGIALRDVVRARNLALSAQRAAEQRTWDLVLNQARSSVERDPTEALAWLAQYPRTAGKTAEAEAIGDDALSRGVAWRVLRFDDARPVSVAFSPDGTTLAVSHADGKIELAPVAGGAPRAVAGQSGFVGSLIFSRDGRWLISGSEDHKVIAHDTRDPSLSRLLAQAPSEVFDLSLSPDGATLAAALADGDLWLVPIAGGEPKKLHGHHDLALSVAFSPDGKTLASSDRGGTVLLWKLDGSVPPRLLAHGRQGAKRIRFLNDGELVGVIDGGLRIVPVDGRPERLLGDLHSISYGLSVAGGLVATGSMDDRARVWDPIGGAVQPLVGHSGAVSTVALSADGRQLASASKDGSVRLWHIEPPHGSAFSTLGASTFDLSHDGRAVATTGPTGSRLFTDGKLIAQFPAQAIHVAFGPAGVALAGANDVRLWSPSGDTARSLLTTTGRIASIQFSPHGRWLAALETGTLTIVDVAAGKTVCSFHERQIASFAFSPDESQLVWATPAEKDEVRLSPLPGCTARLLYPHDGWVHVLAFSPDGRRVASASEDRTVGVWDLAAAKLTRLNGHRLEVYAVAFSPDGTRLASGGADGMLRVWSAGGALERTLIGHQAAIYAVDFSSDGSRLVSMASDQTVRVWDRESGAQTVFRAGPFEDFLTTGDRRHAAFLGKDGRLWSWPVDEAPLRRGPLAAGDLTTARIDALDRPTSP